MPLPLPRLLVPLVGRRPASAPASRRDRARRSVLAGLAAVAAVNLGLGLAAEAYPRIRDPLYGDKFVKLAPRAAASPTKIVMLGSSRTGLAFHGKRVEEALAATGRPAVAFNFGVPASGPVTHLVYLGRLLDAGVVPDLLLVEVMPSMLATGPGTPLERNWFYADRLTMSEVGTVARYGFPADETRTRWAKSVAVPWYALRFQLLSRVVPSWLPWQLRFDWSKGTDASGWGRSLVSEVDAERRAAGVKQSELEYAGVLAGLHPGGPAVDALRELLTTCRARGVPVRLVLMPEGTPFRGWYGPGANDRLLTVLGELAVEFAVSVTDARGWLPDEAFHDGHHMLPGGSEQFTDRLVSEVIAPQFPAEGSK